jgi:hypothetical protein
MIISCILLALEWFLSVFTRGAFHHGKIRIGPIEIAVFIGRCKVIRRGYKRRHLLDVVFA